MPAPRLIKFLAASLLVVATCMPAKAFIPYDSDVIFFEQLTRDVLKLVPRAMGSFIYQNRYDYLRGMTFMPRQIEVNPLKSKDLEEIRMNAFARLNRDIPYCIEAFKGGEIKLDTSATNLSGRLGLIAYSIALSKMPAFPDLEYLEDFRRSFFTAIGENVIDIWVYYDGYGDFHSLGELTERLRNGGMPEFLHVRSDRFPIRTREDIYSQFRMPNKFKKNLIITDVEMNEVYSDIINAIVDTYVFIWKCSGMDLSHPSYIAPPGTILSRPSLRRTVRGGVLASTVGRATDQGEAREIEGMPEALPEELPEALPPGLEPEAAPEPAPTEP